MVHHPTNISLLPAHLLPYFGHEIYPPRLPLQCSSLLSGLLLLLTPQFLREILYFVLHLFLLYLHHPLGLYSLKLVCPELAVHLRKELIIPQLDHFLLIKLLLLSEQIRSYQLVIELI